MNDLYNQVCFQVSKITTTRYSTSFSSGILLFDKTIRQDIYNIYGYVRFADEIVDTYTGDSKVHILQEFKQDTFVAIERGISLNPIIHSFQLTVNRHRIDKVLIEAFLDSMAMDLDQKNFDQSQYEAYIYGSAEVIGLMCLSIFTPDSRVYQELKPYAIALGSVFQKINFLRDMKSDYHERGRVYFPQVQFAGFSNTEKRLIEKEISKELAIAKKGVLKLPKRARYGVLLAYSYYASLFEKIRLASPMKLISIRIRVPNYYKAIIMLKIFIISKTKFI